MDRRAFFKLYSMLIAIGESVDSKYVPLEEQVALFVNVLEHHTKNRIVYDLSRTSRWPIIEYFNKMLRGVIRLHSVLLKQPVPNEVNSTDKRWKWFKV